MTDKMRARVSPIDHMTYDDGKKKHVAVPSLEQEIRSLKRWLKVIALAFLIMALVAVVLFIVVDRHNLWNQSLRGLELCRYAWDACSDCKT